MSLRLRGPRCNHAVQDGQTLAGSERARSRMLLLPEDREATVATPVRLKRPLKELGYRPEVHLAGRRWLYIVRTESDTLRVLTSR